MNNKVEEMNVEQLVDELMERFRAIHQQLNIIEIQTSHQNKKILHLESKVNAIKSIASQIQDHQPILSKSSHA